MSRRRHAIAAIAALAAAGVAEPRALADDTLSRISILVPVFTRHVPHDSYFNDDNWGAFAEVALGYDFAVIAGDFINSYHRNTAVAAVSWSPLELATSHVRFRAGVVVGLDLNGGYAEVSSIDPLLGAAMFRIEGRNFVAWPERVLDQLGIAITMIPPAPQNGALAVNLALAIRL